MRIITALCTAAAVLMGGAPARAQSAPCVQIMAPQPEQILPGPDVAVHFQAAGLPFSPGGYNLHFVLDDEPFEVQYNASHPHIFRDVRPGTHTVRVFAADHLHQAIPGTLSTVTFHVAYPNDENRPAPGLPMLTYNLPQGEYMGIDAGDILLNFLVSGASLGPGGYQVHYYVDGRRYIANECRTYPLPELAPGPHRVRVELMDPSGLAAAGPFNSVERLIMVSPDKTPPRRAPGEPPPFPATIPSIHGPMTGGQPWVAIDEQTRDNTAPRTGQVTTPRGEDAAAGFQVRRENIPSYQTERVVRNEDMPEDMAAPADTAEPETVERMDEEPVEQRQPAFEIREVEPQPEAAPAEPAMEETPAPEQPVQPTEEQPAQPVEELPPPPQVPPPATEETPAPSDADRDSTAATTARSGGFGRMVTTAPAGMVTVRTEPDTTAGVVRRARIRGGHRDDGTTGSAVKSDATSATADTTTGTLDRAPTPEARAPEPPAQPQPAGTPAAPEQAGPRSDKPREEKGGNPGEGAGQDGKPQADGQSRREQR